MSEQPAGGRQALIDDIMLQHAAGRETLGAAIRRLRLEVTGLDQQTFAAMCSLSTKALYQIEKDKGNPSLATLEAILRKFGLRLGLVPMAKAPVTPVGPPAAVPRRPARGANPRRASTARATPD
ncbi:helix-turn-helix transcriptional regulator [Pseudomonas sp. HR96]|uniref:helix-turn-helix domain-containing protein n=1 Tax=Pseudomonas sp. HR96 TaxID=1027966 RepID=UPI002A75A9EF|nr:helix-turn-helix transcriptional regulator [Pseudomonas sp. HR96]WPP02030.1 helix-turn-helix transcriptional regulator [Pseudomonas sp. HR96]